MYTFYLSSFLSTCITTTLICHVIDIFSEMLGPVLLFLFLLHPHTSTEDVDCPNGAFYVEDTCYFESRETVTWDEAEEVNKVADIPSNI